ncbi:Hypp7730 [Branchiostoma lanceolatum]|uniref:Hypp7730 protein n=1 Tax=Branchiostoma lanceolatum TaxID=7740 RepID=A0A8J9Z3K5_BRALA|nr:Hypp7730 [Branchiostoma lanceolatum]
MGIFALLVVTLVVSLSGATHSDTDWKRSLFHLVSPEESDGSHEVPSHQRFGLLPESGELEAGGLNRKSRKASAAALFRPPNRFGRSRSPAMWLDSPNRFGRSTRYSLPFDIPRRFGRGFSLDSDVPIRFGREGEEAEETPKKSWSIMSFQRPFRFGRASAASQV